MRVPSRDVNMASELRRFGDQPTNSPSGGFSFLSLFSQPLMIYSAQEERREGEINLNYLRDLRRFIHSRSFSLLFFLHCHSLSLSVSVCETRFCPGNERNSREQKARGRDISALIGSGCRKRSNVWSETRTHREKEYTCCVRVQHRWSSLSDFSNFFLSFLLLRVLESQFLKISRPIFRRVDHFEPFLVHSFPLCSLSLLYRASAHRCIVTLSASLFLARQSQWTLSKNFKGRWKNLFSRGKRFHRDSNFCIAVFGIREGKKSVEKNSPNTVPT